MIITNVDPFTSTINSTDSNFFKEYDLSDAITICKDSPEINKVVEFLSYPTIKKIDFLNRPDTGNKISNEGQEFNSNSLMVEVEIKERLIYTTKTKSEYVYTYNKSTLKSLSVPIPKRIKEKSVYELFKSSRLQINPHMENIHIRKIDDANVFRTMLLLLDIKFFV